MFYKNLNGVLVEGNNVNAPGFTLRSDVPGDRTRTEDGWKWYDSEIEAIKELGVTKPDPTKLPAFTPPPIQRPQ